MIVSLFSNFMINSSITEYTLYFQVPIFGINLRPHPFSYWHEYTEQIVYCTGGNYHFIQQRNISSFPNFARNPQPNSHIYNFEMLLPRPATLFHNSFCNIFYYPILNKIVEQNFDKTACLSWVSKPRWISSLVCFMACTLWNSGVTPINHLSAHAIIAGDLFFHLLCQIEVLSQE